MKNYMPKYYKKHAYILRQLKINGCSICGYNKHISILEFHHVEPKNRGFNITKETIIAYSTNNLITELNKCMLLCPNCHKEQHIKELNI